MDAEDGPSDAETGDEDTAEADLKDATASFKNWVKTAGVDLLNVYARLGPFEFPAKALTSVKKPKPKAAARHVKDYVAFWHGVEVE